MKTATESYRKQLREICEDINKPVPKRIGGQGIFEHPRMEELRGVIDPLYLLMILDEYDTMEYLRF